MRHICIYLSTHKCFYTRLKLNLSLYFCLCISQRYEKSVEKLQGYINRPLLPIHTAPVFGICHHYDIFIATNNWHHVNYCCVSLWSCAFSYIFIHAGVHCLIFFLALLQEEVIVIGGVHYLTQILLSRYQVSRELSSMLFVHLNDINFTHRFHHSDHCIHNS